MSCKSVEERGVHRGSKVPMQHTVSVITGDQSRRGGGGNFKQIRLLQENDRFQKDQLGEGNSHQEERNSNARSIGELEWVQGKGSCPSKWKRWSV